jgi:endoglucanase
MLLAVADDDRATFDRVWAWTRTHLQRADGLFAWRWDGGQIVDEQPASDADVDIAHALALAIDHFDDDGYRSDLDRLSQAILMNETVTVDGERVLVAGSWAVADRVVNPSYFSPCAFSTLQHATGDSRWKDVLRSSIHIVDTLTESSLPPDWAIVDDDSIRAVPALSGGSDRPEYGPEAARVAMRFGSCDGAARELSARLWPRLDHLPSGGAAIRHDLSGDVIDDAVHPVGLLSASAAARSAGEQDAADELLREARRVADEHQTYYGDAWIALYEAAIADRGDEPQFQLIGYAQQVSPTTSAVTTPPPTVGPPTPTTVGPPPTTTLPRPTTTTRPSATTTAPSVTQPDATAPERRPPPRAPGSAGEEPDETSDAPEAETPAPAPAEPTTTTTAPPPGSLANTPDPAQFLEATEPNAPAPAGTGREARAAIFGVGLGASVLIGVVLGLRQRHTRRAFNRFD